MQRLFCNKGRYWFHVEEGVRAREEEEEEEKEVKRNQDMWGVPVSFVCILSSMYNIRSLIHSVGNRMPFLTIFLIVFLPTFQIIFLTMFMTMYLNVCLRIMGYVPTVYHLVNLDDSAVGVPFSIYFAYYLAVKSHYMWHLPATMTRLVSDNFHCG